MKFAGVLIAALYLWPAWGLASQSACVGGGCGASAMVGFKIVIPPRPISTRLSPVMNAGHARERAVSIHADGKRPDGIVYVVSKNGERPSYTVAKP
jgi:hypothetical protein